MPINLRHFLRRHWRALLLALLPGIFGIALAASVPDVAGTRHNLSASNALTAPGGSSFGATVKATSETQMCVFCHTPHAATSGGTVVAPLWNRALSTQTYTFYNSSSMDASPLPGLNATTPGVGVGSKLCLSCHDGTLALGTIGVLNNAPGSVAMQGTSGGLMPPGTAGASTGYTRNIGINLTNDHPVSFTYDTAQAGRDGELYTPGGAAAVGSRVRGQPRPQFPLVAPLGGQGDQVECVTCHDPHLKDTALNNKFLRGNRLQVTANQVDGTFDPAKDIMCLACHTKPGWGASAHGNNAVAAELYESTAASLRDFPANTTVWQSACLACHDVHTVPGSRRLLREATDSAASPKSGGNSAMEQACYQCHSPSGSSIVTTLTAVPNIKDDFSLAYRMPIVTAEQGDVPNGGGSTGNTVERHDIGTGTGPRAGKDLMESAALLGAGNLVNRHAECPDCHQPHRLTKNNLFNDNPSTADASGTHNHTSPHSNLASGVLRGAFGVEPVYGSASFYAEPVSYAEKRGPVSSGASTAVTSAYVTREYQVCAKCHSSYSFGTLAGTIANPTNLPSLGRTGGTPNRTNGMLFYTDIFREIQAPSAHQGEVSTTDSGAFSGTDRGGNAVNYRTNNHRSWHPVMGQTGRTAAVRNADANNWLSPWNTAVGAQTMYCTDCHGSNTAAGVSSQATDGPPEGPHGSTNIFLLKGWWDHCTGTSTNIATCLTSNLAVSTTSPANTAVRPTSDTTQDLCFKCHSYNDYAGNGAGASGFGGGGGCGGGGMGGGGMGGGGMGCMMGGSSTNLHSLHYGVVGHMRCMWCHVAVPHGWKNKALLVNLNDVGPEANCRTEDTADGSNCTVGQAVPSGSQMRSGTGWSNKGYTNPPYYRNALLKVITFATSGNWNPAFCGSSGPPGTGENCAAWMTGNEGCQGGTP